MLFKEIFAALYEEQTKNSLRGLPTGNCRVSRCAETKFYISDFILSGIKDIHFGCVGEANVEGNDLIVKFSKENVSTRIPMNDPDVVNRVRSALRWNSFNHQVKGN